MHDTHFAISIFIVLLLMASGVAMAAKWVRVGLRISTRHFVSDTTYRAAGIIGGNRIGKESRERPNF